MLENRVTFSKIIVTHCEGNWTDWKSLVKFRFLGKKATKIVETSQLICHLLRSSTSNQLGVFVNFLGFLWKLELYFSDPIGKRIWIPSCMVELVNPCCVSQLIINPTAGKNWLNVSVGYVYCSFFDTLFLNSGNNKNNNQCS